VVERGVRAIERAECDSHHIGSGAGPAISSCRPTAVTAAVVRRRRPVGGGGAGPSPARPWTASARPHV